MVEHRVNCSPPLVPCAALPTQKSPRALCCSHLPLLWGGAPNTALLCTTGLSNSPFLNNCVQFRIQCSFPCYSSSFYLYSSQCVAARLSITAPTHFVSFISILIQRYLTAIFLLQPKKFHYNEKQPPSNIFPDFLWMRGEVTLAITATRISWGGPLLPGPLASLYASRHFLSSFSGVWCVRNRGGREAWWGKMKSRHQRTKCSSAGGHDHCSQVCSCLQDIQKLSKIHLHELYDVWTRLCFKIQCNAFLHLQETFFCLLACDA